MRILQTPHKKLQKLPPMDALNLVHALMGYEEKRQGEVKWLEGRPGYRIKTGGFRVIFEFDGDEIVILDIRPSRGTS